MPRRRQLLIARVVGVGVLMVLGAATAHPQVADSTICGFVVDDAGRPLAGVEVAAVAPQLPVSRRARSDVGGRFALRALPVGIYSVSFDLPGHQWVEIEELRLGVWTTLELRVEMRATTLDETVFLHGGPSLEALATRPTMQLSAAEMAALPALALVQLGALEEPAPGRSPRSELASPERSSAPALELDGRMLGGHEPPPPASALAGLALRGSPGQPGEVLQLITRSGEESLRGSVRGELIDDDVGGGGLAARSARGGQWVSSASHGVQASLGGPLARRLWFFATLGQHREKAATSGSDGIARLEEGGRSSQHAVFLGRLGWQAAESSAVDGSLWLGRDRDRDDLVDPFVLADSSAGFDALREALTAGLSWQHLNGAGAALSVSGAWSASRRELRPGGHEPLLQDVSSDGRHSDGVGGGVFAGAAGFLAHAQDVNDGWLAVRGSWSAGARHELRAEVVLSRREVDWRHLHDGVSGARCVPAHPDGMQRYAADAGAWLPLAPSCDSDGDGLPDGAELGGAIGERWQLADDRFELVEWHGAGDRRGRSEQVELVFEERWLPHPGLSVEGGLSLSPWRYHGSAARLRFDPWQMASPHLGLAWDFEGNGRSRAYLRLGRQRLAPGPQLTSRLAGFEDLSVWELSGPWSDATDPAAAASLRRWRPVAPVTVASDLEPRTVDGVVAGVETEILSDLVVGISAAWSRLAHEVVELSLDGGATIAISNLGGTMAVNPVSGEPLDEAVVLPVAERRIRSFTAFAQRRLRGGWQLMTAVTWGRAEGNIEADAPPSWVAADSGFAGDFLSPESLTGARGALPEDRRWRVLVVGSHAWEVGLHLGAAVSYQSGAPISRLGALGLGRGLDQRFVGQRGDAGRSDGVVRADLRLAWPVSLAAGDLELWLELENASNGSAVLAVDERWTVFDEGAAGLDPELQRTEASWGEPLLVQQPRRLQLGIAYRW